MIGVRVLRVPITQMGALFYENSICSVSRQCMMTVPIVMRRKGVQGRSLAVSCRVFGRGNSPRRRDHYESSGEFIEAFLLESETVRHHNLRKNGYSGEERHRSIHVHSNAPMVDFGSIGHGFLRQFPNPTVFLKIACEGDWLLPIVVGESAIENLIGTLRETEKEECRDQVDLAHKMVQAFEYEVRMVKITERVVSTYFARVYFGKVGEKSVHSVDARPSDAIHLARTFKVPIYVSKRIVAVDAIEMVYGRWRSTARSVYDVLLDSATEGPEPLAEELGLVMKIKTAISDECYEDAALFRDKLVTLRTTNHDR